MCRVLDVSSSGFYAAVQQAPRSRQTRRTALRKQIGEVHSQARIVYRTKFATREAACKAIFEYVEVFYNRERRHSSIGYVSPESFEAALN